MFCLSVICVCFVSLFCPPLTFAGTERSHMQRWRKERSGISSSQCIGLAAVSSLIICLCYLKKANLWSYGWQIRLMPPKYSTIIICRHLSHIGLVAVVAVQLNSTMAPQRPSYLKYISKEDRHFKLLSLSFPTHKYFGSCHQ